MSSKLSRSVLGAVTAGAAALAVGGGSAAADPAQQATNSACYSYSPGYTYCYTDRVLYKSTVTPSGNTQYWAHITSTSTETGPGGYSYSSEDKYSYRYFYKDGVPTFYGSNDKGSYSYPGTACTFKYVFRYVNGEYRVEHSDYQCTPTT